MTSENRQNVSQACALPLRSNFERCLAKALPSCGKTMVDLGPPAVRSAIARGARILVTGDVRGVRPYHLRHAFHWCVALGLIILSLVAGHRMNEWFIAPQYTIYQWMWIIPDNVRTLRTPQSSISMTRHIGRASQVVCRLDETILQVSSKRPPR